MRGRSEHEQTTRRASVGSQTLRASAVSQTSRKRPPQVDQQLLRPVGGARKRKDTKEPTSEGSSKWHVLAIEPFELLAPPERDWTSLIEEAAVPQRRRKRSVKEEAETMEVEKEADVVAATAVAQAEAAVEAEGATVKTRKRRAPEAK